MSNSKELKVKYHGNKDKKSKGRKKNPNVANVSKQGYRDDSPYRSMPYIDIHTPSGSIDMSGTGIPLWANGRILPPYSGVHQFDTETVREIPLAQKGKNVKTAERDATNVAVAKPDFNVTPIYGLKTNLSEIQKDPVWAEPYTFLMNWYSAPETKNRLFRDKAPNDVMHEALNQKRFNDIFDWYRWKREENIKTAESIWSEPEFISQRNEYENELQKRLSVKFDELLNTTSGFHTPADSTVTITKNYRDPLLNHQTAVHELTHATPLDDFYTGYFKKFKPKNPQSPATKQYFEQNPDEIYPRIQDLRYQLWRDQKLRPGMKVTPDMLEEYKNQGTYNLRNYYSLEELARIMNEVAYVPNDKNEIPLAQFGREMPFGMPLKEVNPFTVAEYRQPMMGNFILPDPNRPELMNTGATEFKMDFDVDNGRSIRVPSVVSGQYLGPRGAAQRAFRTREIFPNTADPSAYSKFYDMINRLGIMKPPQQKKGGWLNKYQPGGPIVVKDQDADYYDPVADVLYLSKQRGDESYGHEMYHRQQREQGRLRDAGEDPYGKARRKPVMTENQAFVDYPYYNRRLLDQTDITNEFLDQNPSFRFVNPEAVYNMEINPAMYNTPWTAEGEARASESPEGRAWLESEGIAPIYPTRKKGGPLPKHQTKGPVNIPANFKKKMADPTYGYGLEWFKNWYSNPETQKRLEQSGLNKYDIESAFYNVGDAQFAQTYPELMSIMRKDLANEYGNNTKKIDKLLKPIGEQMLDEMANSRGFSISGNGSFPSLVYTTPQFLRNKDEVFPHELMHVSMLDKDIANQMGAISTYINPKLKEFYPDLYKEAKKSGNKELVNQMFENVRAGDEQPMLNEIYPYIQSVRYELGVKPGDVITDEMLNKYTTDYEEKAKQFPQRHRSGDSSLDRLLKMYSKPKLIQFMNTVAENKQPGMDMPMAQKGLNYTNPVSQQDSVRNMAYKTMLYEQERGSGLGTGLSNFGNPNLPAGADVNTAVDWYMQNMGPQLGAYPTAMEKAEAGDFLYNSGKQLQGLAIQEYLRKTDPQNKKGWQDAKGDYKDRYNPNTWGTYWTEMSKLPTNDRRVYGNLGRDWYYKNINNPAPGVPSDAYNNTWYGRIWNTNDYTPFISNNPKFTPKKRTGGPHELPAHLPEAYKTGGRLLKRFQVPPSEIVGDSRLIYDGGAKPEDDDRAARVVPSLEYTNSDVPDFFKPSITPDMLDEQGYVKPEYLGKVALNMGTLPTVDVTAPRYPIPAEQNSTLVRKPVIMSEGNDFRLSDENYVALSKTFPDPYWSDAVNFMNEWYSNPEIKKRYTRHAKQADYYTNGFSPIKDIARANLINDVQLKNELNQLFELNANQQLTGPQQERFNQLRDIIGTRFNSNNWDASNLWGLQVTNDENRFNPSKTVTTFTGNVKRDIEGDPYSKYDPELELRKVDVHELSHVPDLDDMYGEYTFNKDKWQPKKVIDPWMNNYLKENPVEVYPRIMELRYLMHKDGIKPGTKVTPEMIKKYMTGDTRLDILQYYTPEELAPIMNEIAQNNQSPANSIQTGPEMPSARKGGLPKAQKGITAAAPSRPTSELEENRKKLRESIGIPTNPKASKAEIDYANKRGEYFDYLRDAVPTWNELPIKEMFKAYDLGIDLKGVWDVELQRRKAVEAAKPEPPEPIESLEKRADEAYGRTWGQTLGDFAYNLDHGWNPFDFREDAPPAAKYRKRPAEDTQKYREFLLSKLNAVSFDEARKKESERISAESPWYKDFGPLNADLFSKDYSTLPWVSENWRNNLFRDTAMLDKVGETNPAKGMEPFDHVLNIASLANPYTAAATWYPILAGHWGQAPADAEKEDSYMPYALPAFETALPFVLGPAVKLMGKGFNKLKSPSALPESSNVDEVLETFASRRRKISSENAMKTLDYLESFNVFDQKELTHLMDLQGTMSAKEFKALVSKSISDKKNGISIIPKQSTENPAASTVPELGKKKLTPEEFESLLEEIFKNKEFKPIKIEPATASQIKEVESGLDWLRYYYSQPGVKQRWDKMFGQNASLNKQLRDLMTGRINKHIRYPNEIPVGEKSAVAQYWRNLLTGNQGIDFFPNNPEIDQALASISSDAIHEGTHWVSKGDVADKYIRKYIKPIFGNDPMFSLEALKRYAKNPKQVVSKFTNEAGQTIKLTGDDILYYTSPGESYARINEIRKILFDAKGIQPGEIVNEKDVVEALINSDLESISSWFKIMSVYNSKNFLKNLTKAMNTLPAVGGAGLLLNETTKPQKRKGGPIQKYQVPPGETGQGPVRPVVIPMVGAGVNIPEVTNFPQPVNNVSFSQAFREARNAGLKEFVWNGKRYGTKLKSEMQPVAPAVVPVKAKVPPKSAPVIYPERPVSTEAVSSDIRSLLSSTWMQRYKQTAPVLNTPKVLPKKTQKPAPAKPVIAADSTMARPTSKADMYMQQMRNALANQPSEQDQLAQYDAIMNSVRNVGPTPVVKKPVVAPAPVQQPMPEWATDSSIVNAINTMKRDAFLASQAEGPAGMPVSNADRYVAQERRKLGQQPSEQEQLALYEQMMQAMRQPKEQPAPTAPYSVVVTNPNASQTTLPIHAAKEMYGFDYGDAILSGLGDAWQGVKDFGQGTAKDISSGISDTWDASKQFGQDVWNKTKDVAENVAEEAFDMLGRPDEERIQQIDKLSKELSTIEEKMQKVYYDVTNPDSKTRKESEKELESIYDQRKGLITQLNDVKSDIGWIDLAANKGLQNAPEMFGDLPVAALKALQKGIEIKEKQYPLIDEFNETEFKLPKLETYAQKKERDDEEHKQSNWLEDLDTSKHPFARWKYRINASNDKPMLVTVHGTRGDRDAGKYLPVDIQTEGTVGHFLDQNPLSGYMHPNTANMFKGLAEDDYVGKLEPTDQKDVYAVKFVKRKTLPKDFSKLTKNAFVIRQDKFDDINFDKKVTDTNFGGHTYWYNKGKKDRAIPLSSSPDPNVYDYSSGGNVYFIFEYKGKTKYISFAGSPNEIRKEGERLKKDYKLDKGNLIVSMADAGSYGSSIRSNNDTKRITNTLLNDKSYGYFNRNSFTGAGMSFVGFKK